MSIWPTAVSAGFVLYLELLWVLAYAVAQVLILIAYAIQLI